MSLHQRKKDKAKADYANAELREAFKDGFDYYEDALKLENAKSMWWTIGSFLVIIILSSIMYTMNQNSLELFATSLVCLCIVIINGYHVSKWLGTKWCVPITGMGALLFFFLGRGDISFQTLYIIWETYSNKA